MAKPLVLVVDDHAGFRRIARRILEEGGFGVAEVATGTEAVAAARTLAPDVVLLDVQLPDVDGFTVTRSLLMGSDPPPVVLTSTREAADYGERVAASGAAGFIPKATLSATELRGLIDSR